MLLSKNVNNNVSKDSPIIKAYRSFKCYYILRTFSRYLDSKVFRCKPVFVSFTSVLSILRLCSERVEATASFYFLFAKESRVTKATDLMVSIEKIALMTAAVSNSTKTISIDTTNVGTYAQIPIRDKVE